MNRFEKLPDNSESFRVGDLHIRFTKDDLYLLLNDIQLDFWDVDTSTTTAIMHMFTDASRDVSYDKKLARMLQWQSTIVVFDSLMLDTAGTELNREELIQLLKSGKVPRPINVLLRGGSDGLRNLYETLKFTKNPDNESEYLIPWESFVQLCKSGDFVKTWEEVKTR